MSRTAPDGLPRDRPLLTLRPARGWRPPDLRGVWQFRDLLALLAGRDVRLRYRQTALGALWVVLQPALAAGLFTFVFGRVAGLPSDGVPYFVFSFAGLLGWNAFSSTLARTSGSLVGNADLISKVYFPRLVLPLSTLGSTLMDLGVSLAALAVLLGAAHVTPGWGLLLLPVWLSLILLLAAGLGLLAAALAVPYRDVMYVLPVLTQLLLYACPVAYSARAVPAPLRAAYGLNPLSGLLEAFRWSLLGQGEVDWGRLGYDAAAAAAAFAVGAAVFGAMERRFADVI